MDAGATSRSVRRDVDAPAGRIFDLLVSPGEHHRLDASSMVGAAVTPQRVAGVGDVFTMEMTYRSGDLVEHYRTDNHVTAYEHQRCLEWAVAPHGEQPLGWRWRHTLEPEGDARTRVTLTYDWSGTPEANVRRFGVPLFDDSQMAASLALLAAAVEES